MLCLIAALYTGFFTHTDIVAGVNRAISGEVLGCVGVHVSTITQQEIF